MKCPSCSSELEASVQAPVAAAVLAVPEQQTEREFLLQRGLCLVCKWRSVWAERGDVCPVCTDKAERKREWERRGARVYQVDRYWRRRDAGLCPRCGDEPRPGKVLCAPCAALKAATKRRARERKAKGQPVAVVRIEVHVDQPGKKRSRKG